MKRFFIKYWWAFPILLTVSPLALMLSSDYLYSLDWSAKLPILILYVLVFLLSFIALLASWIILIKNKQWWRVITSLLASVLIICALWFFLQPWLGTNVVDCQSESLKSSIERQLKEYPESRVLDVYKCFCQDNLGPEHLIPSKEAARTYLMSELTAYRHDLDSSLYEKPTQRYFAVGDEGNYVRVDLSVILDSIISAENYLDAFVRSANEGVHRSPEEWKHKWTEIASCIREHFPSIPHATQDLTLIDSIMTGDDLIIHHSDAFGDAYHPHYRIISKSIFESEILPLIQNKK